MLVFVSYCLRDVLLVKSLILQLGVLGYNVQFEPKMPGGGIRWKQVVTSIEECDIFILALTDHMLESESRMMELQYARMLGKPILPIILAGMTQGLPSEFTQVLDYTVPDKPSNNNLAQALKTLPRRTSTVLETITVPDWRAFLLKIRALIKAPSLTAAEQQRVVVNLQELLERQETLRGGQSLLRLFSARKDLDESVQADVKRIAQELQYTYTAQRRARWRNIGLVSTVVIGMMIVGAFFLYRRQSTAQSQELEKAAQMTQTVVVLNQDLTVTGVILQVSATDASVQTATAASPVLSATVDSRFVLPTNPNLTLTAIPLMSSATADSTFAATPDPNAALTAIPLMLSATAAAMPPSTAPLFSATPPATRTLQAAP